MEKKKELSTTRVKLESAKTSLRMNIGRTKLDEILSYSNQEVIIKDLVILEKVIKERKKEPEAVIEFVKILSAQPSIANC